MIPTFRSLIFVPGINAKFLDKAKKLNADIVCFDLEDSVLPQEKVTARMMVADVLKQRADYNFTKNVYVRINSPESGISNQDLISTVQKGLDGIVVPKINEESEVVGLTEIITQLEQERGIEKGNIKLMPSIETAKGVVNAYSIAGADSRVNALIFGLYDFLHDMHLDYADDDGTGYTYARMKIPIDARAAGIVAIDAIWQRVADISGLRNDAATAKRLGYVGKSIIHPTHIEPVHEIFKPSKIEIGWATKVVNALGPAMEKGKGIGAVKLEGKMIDAVHYKQAKAILDIVNH
ncbi:MAG TPA: CoA ester lyase [Candidatus Bathyarchaeia archaeon]|nr:CoA ester lyase [Candidatus Bathyarchaeia archaeon]